ncbi:MAG: sigma-70 family RNA polymerase sigma factor [Planctomycetes bacterium]|nr:sigma-70 family RNA polymerase sigma factor [Planctomycetota bacterium]
MAPPDELDTDELLRRFLPGLRGFLRLRAGRLLLEKESCSDLAQSVCRDVLENVGKLQLDGEESFRRWLYTTAARKIADRYEYYLAGRRNVNREADRHTGDDARTLEAYAGFYSPSQHAAAREELLRVEDAFARLRSEEQDVVLMAKMMGLSRQQIAAETGRSEAAVRKQLSRALARLTDMLATPEGDE